MKTAPVIALYDNEEAGEGELVFREGDILIPFQEGSTNESWIMATHLVGGVSGLVPRNYVKDLGEGSSEMRAEYDLKAEEENELSLAEGEIVKVLHRISDDWLLCRNSKQRYGMVPANYLTAGAGREAEDFKSKDHTMHQSGIQTDNQPPALPQRRSDANLGGEPNRPDFLRELKSRAPRKPSIEDLDAVPTFKEEAKNKYQPGMQSTELVSPPMHLTGSGHKRPSKSDLPKATNGPTAPDLSKTAHNSSERTSSSSEKTIRHEENDIVKASPLPDAPKFRLPKVTLKSVGGSDAGRSLGAANVDAIVDKSTMYEKPRQRQQQQPKAKTFEPRIWTSKQGSSKQEAVYKGMSSDDQKVLLEKPDGKIIQVPIDSLSSRDVEYVNRQEGRTIMVPIKSPDASKANSFGQQKTEKATRAESKTASFSVDGFNWLTFLQNNTSLPKDTSLKYAEIFSKNGIGEKKMRELDAKKAALLGIRIADMDEVMGAIQKMKEIIRKTDEEGQLTKMTRKMSLDSNTHRANQESGNKTTIMIPQFAIEAEGSQSSANQKGVIIEKRVEQPVVQKIIESNPIVYEIRHGPRNDPQPNPIVAVRQTSPGIIHRTALGHPPYPQDTYQQQNYHQQQQQYYQQPTGYQQSPNYQPSLQPYPPTAYTYPNCTYPQLAPAQPPVQYPMAPYPPQQQQQPQYPPQQPLPPHQQPYPAQSSHHPHPPFYYR